MSGLVKQKEFDWKDSNVAKLGSDEDRKVKKGSAETERAWKGAGQRPGVQVWRINKFKVDHVQREEYGQFYNGDSYIILNTYKKPDSNELLYDVHFWIGKHSTQDEYGTAAYKTVELDTLLDDKPVQHREVEEHESNLFMTYFPTFTKLEGGNATGFKHVKPKEYKTRLFHVKKEGQKKGNVTVKEIPPYKGLLSSDDVYIIDGGLTIYQWNGEKSSKEERYQAILYVTDLKGQRCGRAKSETFEQAHISDEHKMYELLQPGTLDQSETNGSDDSGTFGEKLYRLSDARGELKITLVNETSVPRAALDSSDVFLADTGKHLFVWIGKNASEGEKQNGLSYAHAYLSKTNHPFAAVTVMKEGQENDDFKQILD